MSADDTTWTVPDKPLDPALEWILAHPTEVEDWIRDHPEVDLDDWATVPRALTDERLGVLEVLYDLDLPAEDAAQIVARMDRRRR